MDRIERAVRLLPAPAKATVKRARHAVDPLAVTLYRRRTAESRPIPPSSVRARAGLPRIGEYLGGGGATAAEIDRALSHVDRRIADFQAVLDYGCGAGRVLRFVIDRGRPDGRFAGTDVDAEAITWARQHLARIDWHVNRYRPPLPFGEAEFDLVYSVSIFSHLDEELQFQWLDEIARVTRPGGFALLSFHGPYAYEQCRSGRVVSNSMSCAQRVSSHGSLDQERFIYEPYDVGRWNRRDFPGIDDTFGMTFHSHDYVRETWARHWDVLDVLPRALGSWQDLPLLRRRP